MSVHSVRADHIAVSKPASSFDFAKALVWLAAASAPWAALYLIGKHVF
jgi:hypothetical protein